MNLFHRGLTAVLVVSAAGTLLFQARQASDLRETGRDLRQDQNRLFLELRELQQQTDECTNCVATLEQENARLRSGQLAAEVEQLKRDAARWRDAARPLQTPWVRASASKVALLKERLARFPRAQIPEFQFLTPEDWLAAASRPLETDDDFRRALAALRTAAEQAFFGRLHQALNNYQKGRLDEFPAALTELKPCFTPPVDEAVLDRWKIAPKEEVYGVGDYHSKSIITQKEPVDEEYDACFVLGATGNAQSTFKYQKVMRTLLPVLEAVTNSGLSEKDFLVDGHPDFSALRRLAKTPDQKDALEFLIQELSPPR